MLNNNMATRGKNLSKIDLAYMAGFIDGEGCISIYKWSKKKMKNDNVKTQGYGLELSIGNTDYKTLRWIQDNVGGKIYEKKIKINLKKLWIWKMTGTKLTPFLKLIIPYLKQKKEQARSAFEFRKAKERKLHQQNFRGLTEEDAKFRKKCFIKIKQLKKGLPAETKREDAQ